MNRCQISVHMRWDVPPLTAQNPGSIRCKAIYDLFLMTALGQVVLRILRFSPDINYHSTSVPYCITPRVFHTDHLNMAVTVPYLQYIFSVNTAGMNKLKINMAVIGRTSGRGLAAFKQRNASQQYVLGYRVKHCREKHFHACFIKYIMCQQV